MNEATPRIQALQEPLERLGDTFAAALLRDFGITAGLYILSVAVVKLAMELPVEPPFSDDAQQEAMAVMAQVCEEEWADVNAGEKMLRLAAGMAGLSLGACVNGWREKGLLPPEEGK